MGGVAVVNDADKYWEIMAAVIPVIALAFILEVRYLQLHKMGPFMRLLTAVTHTLTIFVLLFSELSALNQLLGTRQARWAEFVALYGCVAALSVVLATPATQLLLVAVYGTSWASYVSYWSIWKDLRGLRSQVKQLDILMRKNGKLLKGNSELIGVVSARADSVHGQDLKAVWDKQSLLHDLEKLQSDREQMIAAQATMQEQKRIAVRAIHKFEKKAVNITGARTKRLLRELDKQSGRDRERG